MEQLREYMPLFGLAISFIVLSSIFFRGFIDFENSMPMRVIHGILICLNFLFMFFVSVVLETTSEIYHRSFVSNAFYLFIGYLVLIALIMIPIAVFIRTRQKPAKKTDRREESDELENSEELER